MRLLIEGPEGALFDYSATNENALVPTDDSERAAVFNALVGALAVLARVKPQSLDAKEVATGQSTQPSLQCPSARKPSPVVRLVARRGDQGV